MPIQSPSIFLLRFIMILPVLLFLDFACSTLLNLHIIDSIWLFPGHGGEGGI